MRRPTAVTCITLSILVLTTLARAATVPSPEEFLGHRVGEDRYLAPWKQVVSYLEAVADASDRVSIEVAGQSTQGRDMPVVILTSAANQEQLDHYRAITRRLADPGSLKQAEAERLVAEGKVVVLITCTIHASEVGATQMAMEFAYDLATTRDDKVLRWMDDVILLLMPSANPDGQAMVVDWYNQHLGGEFEGSRMPWLYHHYVGHDNNRDFYMLTQKESRAINDVLYQRWFPQIYLDEHQMGSTGPRMFVPPQTDPLAAEVHSLIFRQADLLGTSMAMRLEEAGKTGVGSNMIFDSYWPGGTRNTAWWKNVTGLLTEVASAQRATPIYIDPGELRGGSKGLPEYTRRANFPSPWPGGWWRLRDIIDYELIATRSVLETASRYRESILRNFWYMAKDATARGASEPPYAFLIPPSQHDPVATAKLVELLLRHGVRVQAATRAFSVGRARFAEGTYVVPAAQPFRAFLLTMLRPQRYPEVTAYRGGPVLPPYDATTWSLPISMGVELVEAEAPFDAPAQDIDAPRWPAPSLSQAKGGYLIPRSADTVFTAVNRLLEQGRTVYWLGKAAGGASVGDLYLAAQEHDAAEISDLARDLHLPVHALDKAPSGAAFKQLPVRVGLFKPWRASMDEGWTRFLLDQYEFDYVSLHNEDLRDGTFGDRIDVMLLPDVSQSVIKDGKPSSERARYGFTPLPPEYSGGIGKEGGEALASWVREGGTVVAMNGSTEFLIDLLELPVSNVLSKTAREEFNCPGSMLRVLVDTEHPLGWGMRGEEAAYFNRGPAFATRVPDARFTRQVVARYPSDRRDILISGYLVGDKLLERRAAVVEIGVGAGRVVLIGFKPQHRAQPHRTFKLLFNALFQPGLEEVEGGLKVER